MPQSALLVYPGLHGRMIPPSEELAAKLESLEEGHRITAEVHEEIGLKPGDVDVIGELDDQRSVESNYIITPFTGFIPYPYNLVLNALETEELYEVPISVLLAQDSDRQVLTTRQGERVTPAYDYQGNIIWGATVRILNQFLDIWHQAKNSR